MEIPDYYDFLQISPSAEPDTIHRVYRFLAARFHPDNQETGDAERFFLLKQAYTCCRIQSAALNTTRPGKHRSRSPYLPGLISWTTWRVS